jgi:hypothetical protein
LLNRIFASRESRVDIRHRSSIPSLNLRDFTLPGIEEKFVRNLHYRGRRSLHLDEACALSAS